MGNIKNNLFDTYDVYMDTWLPEAINVVLSSIETELEKPETTLESLKEKILEAHLDWLDYMTEQLGDVIGWPEKRAELKEALKAMGKEFEE